MLLTNSRMLSLGAIFKTALLNTVIGMGTVFCVLIFISFLISTFIWIPKIQTMFEKKKPDKEDKHNQEIKPQSTQAKEKLSKDKQPIEDLELVAVITAAIAASTGKKESDFVVRSIKRSKANHWNKMI